MIKLDVPIIVNGTEKISNEIAYDYKDFPYQRFCMPTTIRKKNKTYLNLIITFDIEATTIKPREHGNTNEYPIAYMYHWQFCVFDPASEEYAVVFGRLWEEYIEFITNLTNVLQLSSKRLLICYVHNLGYEFQFLKDFFEPSSIFAKSKRKPMKYTTRSIEYRCSYFLSNMSLSKFCENSELCIHYKLVDEYDYKKFRTPYTPMTNTELSYCFNDVCGLAECIYTLLQDDTLATIPLTNTGYVRREYRSACNNKEYRHLFEKLALSADQYILCKKAFRGGDTHANRNFTYEILSNVYSFDLQSSYPAAMLLDEYPMSKFMWVSIKNQSQLDNYIDNYCCVLDITIFDIESIDPMPYIDIAHCYQKCDIINDNGRVLRAKMVSLCLTNIDLKIIRDTYTYSGLLINKCMISKKGKLPNEIRNKMLHFYTLKTQLKGIKGKEYEYMKSKNRTNSGYGMMVTDIAHSEITYNLGEWGETKPDIVDALSQYYKSRNSFLSYQWGIFVTANARYRLYQGRKIVGNDEIYQDTDSVKFRNWEHIKAFLEYNKKLIHDCETNDIPAYAIKDGKKYYLGIWDFDGYYKKFITLGAKKYCYVDKNDKLHITVAGMNKKLGAKAVGKIENFKIGKVYQNVGRTVAYYNESKPHYITVGGDTFLTASNIAIVDTTYELGVTNEYWELIGENVSWLLEEEQDYE